LNNNKFFSFNFNNIFILQQTSFNLNIFHTIKIEDLSNWIIDDDWQKYCLNENDERRTQQQSNIIVVDSVHRIVIEQFESEQLII
jgi:hypothetical protein